MAEPSDCADTPVKKERCDHNMGQYLDRRMLFVHAALQGDETVQWPASIGKAAGCHRPELVQGG
jgi:hypothetical protein